MSVKTQIKRKGNDEMLLEDYIRNSDIAKATEIYNAKPQSVEEALTLMQRMAKEQREFNGVIYEFNHTLYNIKVCLSKIAFYKESLKRLNEFNNSHIAKLMEKFITTHDKNVLKEIQKEINSSHNNFGVYIIPKYEPGHGERMYGTPTCAYFHVDYIERFYTFDNFDIAEDIKAEEERIHEWEQEIDNWMDKKFMMYDTYRDKPLLLLFSKFEEEYGPLTPDKNWTNTEIIYDDDDDDDF